MQDKLRSKSLTFSRLLQFAIALPVGLSTSAAYAHISVDDGGTHKARTTEQKTTPCGASGAARGANVYTYKPGATINVAVAEFIPHPGYFRIAFDNDGDDAFEIPAGTDGKDGNCAGDPKCGAGMSDFCNNDAVLLDNLDQHAAGGGKTYTWSVKLPDIECDNCTLQIIQMMNDFNYHPAAYPADDIYYQCIDIVLSNDAPDVTDTPVENNGMNCKADSSSGAAGAAGATGAAGAPGTAGTTGAAGAAVSGTAGSAGASMSAAAGASGSAGATAAAGAGKGGSAAETKPTTSAAGRAAPSTTASTGTAGKPATGSTPSSGSAGTTSSASTGTMTAASTEEPAAEEGGCSVAHPGAKSNLAALSVLSLVGLSLGVRRRQRIRA